MRTITFLSVFAATSLFFFGANAARAQWVPQWNQKLTLTFDNPVQIPGHVLEPGTYVFELGVGDTSMDENVVRVYDKNKDHLYGVFLTIPDHRLIRANKPVLDFEKTASGPEAIYAWFYPNDKTGHEFVYPRSEAMRLAKENNRAVASMPDELTSDNSGIDNASVNALTGAHVTAVTPSGQEVQTITVFGTPAH